MVALSAVALGIVAGLRSMLAPCAVSWAVWAGVLHVENTPLAFMGFHYTRIIFTVLAAGELIADKLPTTPSRKTGVAFIARVVSGGVCGATIGAAENSIALMAVFGVTGAVTGTLGGAAARAKLAAAFRRDLPAALLEDCAGIALAASVLQAIRRG